jgi:hypothetical protein
MSEQRVIVFEGFADTEPGWEFDMPVYMIRPVKQEGCGGNVGYAENMIEDYLIELYPADEPESEEGDWSGVMRQFRRAREGEGKPDRLVYWRRVVTITGNEGVPNDEFTNVAYGEMHYGPLPAEARGTRP